MAKIKLVKEVYIERGKASKLKFYLFCAKWLWKNRKWDNNRYKFKAMIKEWNRRYTH